MLMMMLQSRMHFTPETNTMIKTKGIACRTMPLSFMNMPLLTYIKEISPRPVLIITGEKAHSRYFAETAFRNAAEPKELVIIPGANHVDLYDRKELIPFAKLESFFTKNLAPSAASR